MAEDETDSPRDSGSLRPMPAGRLEVGMYAELGGRLCKITELVVSKPGKHVINAHIGGVVVQSGQHVSETVRASDLVPATRAPQREYTLLDIDGSDGFVTLLSEKNEEKGDVRLPGGTLGKAIKTRFEAGREVIVTVLELLGEQKIVAYR